MGKPNRRRTLGIALVVALAAAPAGFYASDRIEQDNDFCNECHLTPDVPLHRDIRGGFDATQPVSLAGVHGGAPVEARPDDESFRCIDCHGGTSLVGRLRVKALAAKDAFWYAVGDFDEPDAMEWPLWDEDCRKCHDGFDFTPPETGESPRFHQLPVHDVELGVGCVECHQVHEAGGNPQAYFLAAESVRSQCARCHPEFQQY